MFRINRGVPFTSPPSSPSPLLHPYVYSGKEKRPRFNSRGAKHWINNRLTSLLLFYSWLVLDDGEFLFFCLSTICSTPFGWLLSIETKVRVPFPFLWANRNNNTNTFSLGRDVLSPRFHEKRFPQNHHPALKKMVMRFNETMDNTHAAQ